MDRPQKTAQNPPRASAKKPCRGDPHDLICIDINAWMKAMKVWADAVTKEVNELNAATGDPEKVPPPPPPPFD